MQNVQDVEKLHMEKMISMFYSGIEIWETIKLFHNLTAKSVEVKNQEKEGKVGRGLYLYGYNQIILDLNQQQFGLFQTEEIGQHTPESIEVIGHHIYQEILS